MKRDATASYKDITIPSQLIELIPHMPDVEAYRETLRSLSSRWDLLTMLGQMNEMGTDMSGTQVAFRKLTEELISKLGLETLKKTSSDLQAKAQVAIDILIRNLFERTADIGFLATDDDIRTFLGSEARDPNAMRERFQEYVAKYSVYSDAILLDTNGTVVAQLDQSNPIQSSADPLLAEALETEADYLEVFRKSDLDPGQEQTLVYAFRVTESNEPRSRPLGVLCLIFRFQNELEGIFNNLLEKNDWGVLCIVEPSGKVIASSDSNHIRIGSVVEPVRDSACRVTRYAGRLYLAKTCPTQGYQGFLGLGWEGHVMIPLDQAFDTVEALDAFDLLDERQRLCIEEKSQLFSPELRAIPHQAAKIQQELERTVWNGNVRDTNIASKVLLSNISSAGSRSKEVFREAIGNLRATIVSSRLKDVKFQAALGTDIMDRNLYERANDCRWWALNSEFQRILSKPQVAHEDQQTATGILGYINGLYTVYTNLLLYNNSGQIVAVSNPQQADVLGEKLTLPWVQNTLSLRDTQDYRVSPFEVSSLYENRPTYIYSAAIKDPQDPYRTVGGIGIVFDSDPQFKSMLEDCLPREAGGAIPADYFAVFADRKRRVIACSSDRFQPADTIEIDPHHFELEKGESQSGIIEFEGRLWALGVCSSAGYREYKVEDSYSNDVLCLVFSPLAVSSQELASAPNSQRGFEPGFFRRRRPDEAYQEIATFFIGRQCFGLDIKHVTEAIQVDTITPIPNSPAFVAGITSNRDETALIIDASEQLQLNDEGEGERHCAILLTFGARQVGLLVDALGEIPQVPEDQISREGSLVETTYNYLEGIILSDASDTASMVMILDPGRFLKFLSGDVDLQDWQDGDPLGDFNL